VTVAWLAPHLGTQEEALATAGADDLSRRQTAQAALGEGHRSEEGRKTCSIWNIVVSSIAIDVSIPALIIRQLTGR